MKVSVLGSGVMGLGIAHLAASCGDKVTVFDKSREIMEAAQTRLNEGLERRIAKGKLTEEAKADTLNNLSFTTEIGSIAKSTLVIEAVTENLDIKRQILQAAEEHIPGDSTIATNTSSFSITGLSSALSRPDRFVGLHFFNPAPVMPLVEVIAGFHTNKTLPEQMRNLMRDWKKFPVFAKDTPGFIVNRVARPFYTESLRILEEGLADHATIDHALRSIGNFRMGPFELMDLIGIDTNFSITESLYESYRHEPRYRPSLIQNQMVAAGYLGQKVGHGFYDYSASAEKPQPSEDEALNRRIFERVLCCLINEAADAHYFGVASIEDIETAMLKGVNYPKGLFAWGEEFGFDNCVQTLDRLFDFYHDPRYRVSPWLRNRINR